MKLIKFLRKLKSHFSKHKPSVEILISGARLVENLKEHQHKYPHLLFAPVLKSNAYGHGLVEVANILDKERIAFLVLDSLHEAMILRSNGIKSEILIIGYARPDNIRNSKISGIAFAITSLEQLKEVSEVISSKTKIHLKVDTGMHRQGILPDQLGEAIGIVRENKLLDLEGICSHFADADGPSETFTKSQIEKWNGVVLLFQKNFPTIKFVHISATAGMSYSEQTRGNVARLGIGLYGINSSLSAKLDLRPVLKMQSIISSVKPLKAGEGVGYNITYKLETDSTIATVPVGYFEGVDRRLSNCGFFKIGNSYCPIVGRISMNITSIDITSVSDAGLNNEVTIISDRADDKNSVENIARLAQTIPWEIFVRIPQHLRRTVV